MFIFSFLLKFDNYFCGFDVGVGNLQRLGFHVLASGELEGDFLVIGVDEGALYGLAVEGGDRQVLTHVLAVLALKLQRRVETCRRYVELEVLDVAVEAVLNRAAQLDAVVDGDSVVAVDSHIDAVVGRNLEVDKEFVAAFQRFVYYV